MHTRTSEYCFYILQQGWDYNKSSENSTRCGNVNNIQLQFTGNNDVRIKQTICTYYRGLQSTIMTREKKTVKFNNIKNCSGCNNCISWWNYKKVPINLMPCNRIQKPSWLLVSIFEQFLSREKSSHRWKHWQKWYNITYISDHWHT